MESTPAIPTTAPSLRPRLLWWGATGLAAVALVGFLLWPRLFATAPQQPISSIPAPEVGHPAPDFTLSTLTGDEISLAELRGKPVILNFWATWCPPCRREMPALEVIWQEYGRGGVMILGVDQGESPATVSEYVRQNVGVTFPLLLDRRQDVGDLYLVRSLPTTFFIDAQGIIQEIRVGGPLELDFLGQQARQLTR